VNCEEKDALIGILKREMIQMPAESSSLVNYIGSDINELIPHRPPFALISAITAINLKETSIQATSEINPNDPIFAGHFPGAPVYPGVMQIEAMGQAGLCLAYFVKNNTLEIKKENLAVKGLFTRVHNAGFNKGVQPGDTLIIRVKSIEDDDFMGLMAAQVIMNNEVYSHSILEVYYP